MFKFLKFKNLFQISNFKFQIGLIFFVLIYFFYFSYLSIIKHRNFQSHYYDLAIMDQTVYNTSKGRILELTNPEGTNNFKRMAIHNDIILAFLAPFYWIYSSPETLLVIQSLVLAIGAIPLFLLADKVLNSKPAALILAFAYLIYPPLQWSNLFDFHGVVLATSFILFMIYFSLEKKYLLSFLFFILSILTKEQVALSTGIFAAISFWGATRQTVEERSQYFVRDSGRAHSPAERDRSLARMTTEQKFYLVMFLISVVWFLASIFVIIPYFRGSQHFALARYSDGFDEIKLLAERLFSVSTLKYLQLLFSPLSYIPIINPLYMLMILPELTINLFSNHEAMRGIYHHYTAVITPYLFAGSIMIMKKFNKFSILLTFLILVSSANAFYKYSPTHLSKDNFVKKISTKKNETKVINLWKEALKDENIAVAVTEIIGAHFSQRKKVFRFSKAYPEADYIVIYVSDIYNDWIDKKVAIENYNKLKNDLNFKLVMKKEKFEVFKKMAP